MTGALTQNQPRREQSPAAIVECGDQSPSRTAGSPVPALNLLPRQPGGLPDGSRGSSAATTPGKLPNPPCTPAGCQKTTPMISDCRFKIVECGDQSPLWNSMTCHRVPQRGPARALQNHTLPHSFNLPGPSQPPRPATRDPRPFLSPFPLPSAITFWAAADSRFPASGAFLVPPGRPNPDLHCSF